LDHGRRGTNAPASILRVRDAETSAQDLDHMLTQYSARKPIYEETGALLFSCLGRGEHLYGRPDHDSEMFRSKISSMPMTGFFCNGEIGPIGGSTFLHSYTSAFGVFRPKN
jgi:small ligand-binding sensory domain FIST